MKDEILLTVLNELVEEVKEVGKDQKIILTALENHSKRISEFKNYLNKIEINPPEGNLRNIESLISYSIQELKEIVANQPKEVLHEKKILLYPEGDGRIFLKFILNKFLLYTIGATLIYFTFQLGLEYYKNNNQNERFRYAISWIYQDLDEKDKKSILHVINEFENDSIFKIRKKKFLETKEK